MDKKDELYSERDKLINQSNPLAIVLTIGILFVLGLLYIIFEWVYFCVYGNDRNWFA